MGFVELRPDGPGKKVQAVENAGLHAQVVTVVPSVGLSNGFVGITEGTGKKMRHFQNTIGGNSVHALALVPVDSSGAPLL